VPGRFWQDLAWFMFSSPDDPVRSRVPGRIWQTFTPGAAHTLDWIRLLNRILHGYGSPGRMIQFDRACLVESGRILHGYGSPGQLIRFDRAPVRMIQFDRACLVGSGRILHGSCSPGRMIRFDRACLVGSGRILHGYGSPVRMIQFDRAPGRMSRFDRACLVGSGRPSKRQNTGFFIPFFYSFSTQTAKPLLIMGK